MENIELKHKFALAWMAMNDPFKAAFHVFPSPADTGSAIDAATNWVSDADVLAHRTAALESPLESGALVDKHQAARLVLDRATKCVDDETFGKLMRLYADMMGQIEKPGGVVVNNTNVSNKVLIMPAPLSKDEWSLKATTQQRELSCGNA